MWTPGNLPDNFVLFFTLPHRRLSAEDRQLLRLLTLGCSVSQISTITDKPVSQVRQQRRAVMRLRSTTESRR